MTGNLRSLEPYRSSDANCIFIEQIFDQLLFNERNKGYTSGAVTDWALAPDNMSMTLKLRPDMITHDGSWVDAAMIKWAIDERVVYAELGAGLYTILAPYHKSCRIISPMLKMPPQPNSRRGKVETVLSGIVRTLWFADVSSISSVGPASCRVDR